MTTEEKMEALGELYTNKYGDWVLKVHHILTEPTCPTATIGVEDWDKDDPTPYFRNDADTIQEAVDGVIDMAYRALIQREPTTQFGLLGGGDGLTEFLKALDEYKATGA